MDYYQPKHLQEALDILDRHQPKVLAGGTDVYPVLQTPTMREAMLDISRIAGLSEIELRDGNWRIGATATWTDILNANLPPALAALKQAAREVGSIQIQNRATIIGNLCNASPAADGIPPLLILDAQICLSSTKGERIVPLEDFILGNRMTSRRKDELATELRIPARTTQGTSNFCKLGARRYLVISIAMAAVRLAWNAQGQISECAVAIGACSAVAQRMRRLEQMIVGQSRIEIANRAPSVGSAVFDALSPIDDVRATAAYRLDAAGQLVSRLLQQTAQAAA